MDDSRSKKQKVIMCRPGANSDFISDLPENVTDEILVRLPIGDAVRTSVLSTKWRYKWTTMTQLVFNDHNLGLPENNKKDKVIYYMDRVLLFIDRVLLLHSGFIHKFEVSFERLLKISSIIDCLILFLSRKNTIKEFILKFSQQSGQRYEFPTCFFSAQQISTLELHWCVLKKPPPTFTGYSNLKSLYLHNTTFVDVGGFECLISKCPLLERLTLDMMNAIRRINHLNISFPNLKYLCLRGSFEDICFQNTPLLSDVSIHTGCSRHSDEIRILKKFLRSETGNVVKVLSSLPNLRKFMVRGFFLEFLAMGKIPEKLSFTCHHLNYLYLYLNFKDVNEMCVTLCLLNSSPNLQELHIHSASFCKSGQNIKNFWKERTLIHWNMSGLQIVKITDFTGFEMALEFIKLLLANSPMLEMLSIGCIRYGKRNVQGREGRESLKELLIFPRASPKARIKCFEQNGK